VFCYQGHVSSLNLGGNQLSGNIPPELGDLSNLLALFLSYNELSGSIPPVLGNLVSLQKLYFRGNSGLSGPLPSTLTDLSLTEFYFSETALCEPVDITFQNWLSSIPFWEGTGVPCTPAPEFTCSNVTEIPQEECEALVTLYNSTNGHYWTNSDGWLLTDTPCTWHGVNCGPGFVEDILLSDNQLTGSVPSALGDLSSLERLSLWGNSGLSGPLPSTLTDLSLTEFYFSDTALCEPLDVLFQNWLSSIPLWEGTGVICSSAEFTCSNVTEIPQEECEALVTLYNSTDGPNWTNNTNWLLSNTPCSTALKWFGVHCGSGFVREIRLPNNGLVGSIPLELGELSRMQFMDMRDNQLTGSVPSELGNTSLIYLNLLGNAEFSGPLPSTLTNLALSHFHFSGTELCEPGDVLFQNWLSGIENLSRTDVICVDTFTCSIVSEIPQEECEALITLYNSTDGPNWTNNTNWLSTKNPCTYPRWFGVHCGPGGVISLALDRNNLSGNIPPELGNFSGMLDLRIGGNQLTGSIPPELSNSSYLNTLILRDNELSGNIPPELGHITSLTNFYLQGNTGLSGPLPSTLTNLALGNFQFHETALCEPGDVTFQNWLETIQYLTSTDVTCTPADFTCSIVNEIPQEECETLVTLYNSTDGPNWTDGRDWLLTDTPCSWFGIQCTQLGSVTHIDLGDNNLSGSIPSRLENLVNLDFLALGYNNLNGSIPPQLGNLSNLTYLSVHDNSLDGPIPYQLGDLSNLERLVLSKNQLTENIPADLGKLTNLTDLYLYENQLEGSVPAELGGLTNLRYLYLRDNLLDGPIPSQLGNLSQLNYLVLSNNFLDGEIPSTLGNLENLSVLTVYSNTLSGGLPDELGYLPNLGVLAIHNNPDLSGPVPMSFTSLDLTEFYFNRTDLCELEDPTFKNWLDGISSVRHSGITCITVGLFGGGLVSINGAAEIRIPEGALNEDKLILITELGSDFTLGDTLVTVGVTIGPDGTQFEYPVTVILSWPDDNDDGFVDTTLQDESYLFISKDGVAITDICANDPGCDPISNTFSVEVTSLSDFVLGGLPGEITSPSGPVQIDTPAEVSVTFYDKNAPHTLTWDWGDGEIEPMITSDNPVIHSHAYQTPGVYTLKLTIDEDTGKERSITYQYIVVYDPEGGFVTGGGWIDSPEYAYTPDPTLTGKASFGFVSKYKKGASVPTGNTEFQFQVADLNFHSSNYDWLVVNQNGSNAQYKGVGTINGDGVYKFMLWAGDGEMDTFRIKIWEGEDTVIYDNGSQQELGGGSIVVHTKK
jgi:Leucine-rich repeat (LRR) protein/PKD repeat protein